MEWKDRTTSSELYRDGALVAQVCANFYGIRWTWFMATGAPRHGSEDTRDAAKAAVMKEVSP